MDTKHLTLHLNHETGSLLKPENVLLPLRNAGNQVVYGT